MKPHFVLAALIACLVVFSQQSASSLIKRGAPCKTPGIEKIKDGQNFLCKKKNKKKTWVVTGKCDAKYSGTCVPVTSKDLDCDDLDGKVIVKNIGDDPHGFDADNNGVGCE